MHTFANFWNTIRSRGFESRNRIMYFAIRIAGLLLCLPCHIVYAQRCTALAFTGYQQCGLHCRLSLAAGASYREKDGILSNVTDGLSQEDALTTFGYHAAEECNSDGCSGKLMVRSRHRKLALRAQAIGVFVRGDLSLLNPALPSLVEHRLSQAIPIPRNLTLTSRCASRRAAVAGLRRRPLLRRPLGSSLPPRRRRRRWRPSRRPGRRRDARCSRAPRLAHLHRRRRR